MLYNKQHRIMVLHKSELDKEGRIIYDFIDHPARRDWPQVLAKHIPAQAGGLRTVHEANIVIIYGEQCERSEIIKNRHGRCTQEDVPVHLIYTIIEMMDVNIPGLNETQDGPMVLRKFGVNKATTWAAGNLPMVRVEITENEYENRILK